MKGERMYNLDLAIKEIDEYWDRENQYIKESGIYSPDEIEQILAKHEEIRRNKKQEALVKFKEELQMMRDDAELMQVDDDELDYLDYDNEYDDGMLRDMREERDAYDDFIASLDM